MTHSRDSSHVNDIKIVSPNEDTLSPKSKKGPSASPPIQTNSRFHRNPSSLGLSDVDTVIRRHSQDEVENLLSSVDSGLSYASTSVTTPQTTPMPISPVTGQSNSPQTTPMPISPLTGQSISPVISSPPADTSSLSAILPKLTAPLSPSPQISMPEEVADIIASAEETHFLSEAAEDSLVKMVVSTNNFNQTLKEDPKTLVKSLVMHIWEENLEILSLARLNCPVGIYYPHGINKTVMATGRAVRNRDIFFKPENVSFLTQYGKDANFCVPSLQELNPKVEGAAENFDFNNALIFLPICYTARHVLKGNEFFEVLKYFIFEKKCSIMIYLGRDAGVEENKIKRQDWVEEHKPFLKQIKEMNPEFWEQNKKIHITTTYRHELIKSPQYLYAEYYFARYLAGKSPILNAISSDVSERLTQKKYVSIPTKVMNIRHKTAQTTTATPSTPQLLASTPTTALLFPRPHSLPSSPTTIKLEDQIMAKQIILGVTRSETEEELANYASLTRQMIDHHGSPNPFASIYNIYQPSNVRGNNQRTDSSSEDEEEEEKHSDLQQTVMHIQPRQKR